MNEMRHVKYFLATLMIASLATFGCGGDKKSDGASGGKESADAKAAFGLFPKTTTLVGGLNVAQITGSGLYKKFKSQLDGQMNSGEMKDLQDKCGIDVRTAVKSVVMGAEAGPDMEPKEETVMLVVKGISRAKAVECGKKMDENATVEEDGKFTKVTREGKTHWYGWLDDSTVVVAPKMDKAAMEARMAGKDGMDGNADMMAIVGNTDQTAGIWFAMAPAGGIKAPAGGGPMKMPDANFKAAFGSIGFSSGVKLDIGARTSSADEAGKVKKELDQSMTQLKAMADMMQMGGIAKKLKVSTSGADVVVKLSLSGGDIDQIAKLAQGGMGM